MFAIVEAGGRQEKVTPGAVVIVDRVEAEAGDTFTFDKVLLAGIPCVATPLLSSNCKNTSVDNDWVFESIDLHTPFGFTEVRRDFRFPGVTFSGGGTGVLFRAPLAAIK